MESQEPLIREFERTDDDNVSPDQAINAEEAKDTEEEENASNTPEGNKINDNTDDSNISRNINVENLNKGSPLEPIILASNSETNETRPKNMTSQQQVPRLN